MTKSVKTNRNNRIDFYKAVLIFSVVWGHTINILLNGEHCDCNISWFLRSFDMPMFMFLSGYFLKYSIKKYSMKTLLVNKTTYILFPAVVWSLLVSFGHKPQTLYFLWAVYLSSVLMILIENLRNWGMKILVYLSVILVLHLTKLDFVNMSYLFPFFLLGFYRESLEKNYFLAIPAYVLLICFWSADYSIWKTGSYVLNDISWMSQIVLLRYAIGCAGIFFMKLLFDMVYEYIYPKLFLSESEFKKTGRAILEAGRETLALYILQAIATYGILKILVKYMVRQTGYNPLLWNERLLIYIISPIVAITIIVTSLYIIRFFRKSEYLNKLFGFKLIK